MEKAAALAKCIRTIPDFPKPGILFRDVTTLLLDPVALKKSVDMLCAEFKGTKIDKIAAVESRGFTFGAAMAYKLGCGLVLVRKKGKLPHKTVGVSYDLEYGTDTLEVHEDAIKPGERVLIVDDLLATGGTVCAVTKLVKKLGGKIAGIAFLVELVDLKGKEKLKGFTVRSLVKFEGE
jgi:adenine phosphoribosyltransferase